MKLHVRGLITTISLAADTGDRQEVVAGEEAQVRARPSKPSAIQP